MYMYMCMMYIFICKYTGVLDEPAVVVSSSHWDFG